MMTTVLIDLDDTLLRNHDERYIPTYIDRLSQHFSPKIPANRLIEQLLKATRAMQANDDPERFLIEVFGRNFYPPLDLEENDLQPLFESFFTEVHPNLQELTRLKPGAKSLLRDLTVESAEIVIATNPLYPLEIITQRLDWAGLSPANYSYDLITSYENSHFTKPHLEYYAEILAKAGRSPQEAVMIGDSLENDIEPALELGMAAFHVAENGGMKYPSGGLDVVLPWLKEQAQSSDPQEDASPTNLIARLKGTLAAFHDLPYRYRSDNWDQRPSPDSWAAAEILAHLRDVECEINHPRFEAILRKDEPFLSAVESDRWAEERDYLHENPLLALDGLRQARKRTIAALEGLGEADWHRPARHALFGKTTLLELITISLDHDLTHIRQLRDVFQSV